MPVTVEHVRVLLEGVIVDVYDYFFKRSVPFSLEFSNLKNIIQVSRDIDSAPIRLVDFFKRVAAEDKVQKSESSKRKLQKTSGGPAAKQRKQEQNMSTEDDEPEMLDLYGDEVKQAIENLNRFLKKENLKQLEEVYEKSRDDAEFVVGLGIHMFSKLGGSASTNIKKSKYLCPCGCQQKLKGNGKMFIGSNSTWYGELDIITGDPASGDTVAVVVGEKLEEPEEKIKHLEDSSDSEDGSPENRKLGEVKLQLTNIGINQVAAQAVVFGFTEYNRHREKGHCIPSIIIDKKVLRIVIYNPVTDMLVVSNLLKHKQDKFDYRMIKQIFPLWLVLNHRTFFARKPKIPFMKTGFHETTHLKDYETLNDYSTSVVSSERKVELEDIYGFLFRSLDLKSVKYIDHHLEMGED